MNTQDKVNIRPQVNILSVLKHLEYESWYALAEFVDNSIASYLNNKSELEKANGSDYSLVVSIEIDQINNIITVRDNAAGIHESDFHRAFRAAEVPPDTSGLSEFGMGMKSAACWFSDNWSVKTTALGEEQEKTIGFDLKKIFEDKIEELDIRRKPTQENSHYTEITLKNVSKVPRGRSLGKVKDHLTSIYREFIRQNLLILKVDNEILKFSQPKILKAPYFEDPNGKSIIWKKEIDFPVSDELSVRGFVAIRERGSTKKSGFALFRRGRVIEGSDENGFRPVDIFGGPNSFKYQRVFGELHLEGFNVSFTKKGIQWDENLDVFLQLLRDELSSKSFPLLQQAEGYRVRASDNEYRSTSKSLNETTSTLEKRGSKALGETSLEPPSFDPELSFGQNKKSVHKKITLEFNDQSWDVSIELSFDPSIEKFYEVGNHLIPSHDGKEKHKRQIGIRLSLTHPFMIQHVGTDNRKLEPLLRLIACLGLSEVVASESGIGSQKEIRRNLNSLITKLSEDE